MSNDEQDPMLDEASMTGFQKAWRAVSKGNADFSTWTKLLSIADNEDSLELIRKSYDGFLNEFPLCYVYWKKYADHEANKSGNPKNVYERALTQGVPHSVDLWVYYCGHIAEKSDNLDEIRALFERGIQCVGLDFVAHPLWDKYIEFETSQEEYAKVGEIFSRILERPLEPISSYWERYKLFVGDRSLNEIARPSELQEIESNPSLSTEEEKKAWIIAKREQAYLQSLAEVNKRRLYEQEVLKLPYFHVRPVEESQISNWNAYLTFEENEGNHERIVQLYERCLIPCCNYIAFWFRYINYLESYAKHQANGSQIEAIEASNVFKRACTNYLKKRPEMHLSYAMFEEQYGRIDHAREIYENLLTKFPSHIETVLRYIALEKRQNNPDKIDTLFQTTVSKLTDESQIVFLYIHTAEVFGKFSSDKARNLFLEALEKYPHSKDLWLALIRFEKYVREDNVEDRVNALYEKAVHNNTKLPEADQLALLGDWMEFLSHNTIDFSLFRQLYSEYRRRHGQDDGYPPSSAAKRPHEGVTAGEPPTKVARTGEYENYDYSAYYNYYGYGDYAQAQAQAQAQQAQAQAQPQPHGGYDTYANYSS